MRSNSLNSSSLPLVVGVLSLSTVFLAITLSQEQVHEVLLNDVIGNTWDPRLWPNTTMPEACFPDQSTPDSGFFNETLVGRDKVARYGYPYHYALISGINDTLDALITFQNLPSPEADYDLTGKHVEQWFAPQAYATYVRDPGGPPLVDSTQLRYRMRGWYNPWAPLPTPTVLGHTKSWGYTDYGYYYMKLDIWNLPPGKFQLCVLPTDKIPKDLHAFISGNMIEFYPARNLADSCNGYEGCYWRATYDSNFSAAKNWVGKIMSINPKSVPGWWLKADNALNVQDTVSAKAAYDSAIVFLNTSADPAMPDSTRRPLLNLEKTYVWWVKNMLARNRAELGP